MTDRIAVRKPSPLSTQPSSKKSYLFLKCLPRLLWSTL